MWVYKGIKVNISATTQKNHYSINLQNKSCTNYHNYCRKPWKFVKLGTSHNRKYPIQKQKFSPIVKLNLALFSSVTAIVAPILLIALTLNAKRQQLTAHKIYCEGKHIKVLQRHVFLSPCTFMFLGVTNTIGSISQNKHQLNTANKNVNLHKSTKNTNYSLKIHKLSKNGSSSHTKSSVSIDLFNLPPLPDTYLMVVHIYFWPTCLVQRGLSVQIIFIWLILYLATPMYWSIDHYYVIATLSQT